MNPPTTVFPKTFSAEAVTDFKLLIPPTARSPDKSNDVRVNVGLIPTFGPVSVPLMYTFPKTSNELILETPADRLEMFVVPLTAKLVILTSFRLDVPEIENVDSNKLSADN